MDPSVLNNAGQAAFRASFGVASGGTLIASPSSVATALTQIVRQGQTAPDGIHTFSQGIDKPSITLGQVAFNGDISGIGGDLSWRQGMLAVARQIKPPPTKWPVSFFGLGRPISTTRGR